MNHYKNYNPYESGFSPVGKMPKGWKTVPKKAWGCDQWVMYHNTLKKDLGKRYANSLWADAWEKFGDTQSSRSCKYSRDFIEYFEKQGIAVAQGDMSGLLWGLRKTASGIWSFFQIMLYLVVGIIVLIIVASAISALKGRGGVTTAIGK